MENKKEIMTRKTKTHKMTIKEETTLGAFVEIIGAVIFAIIVMGLVKFGLGK